MEECEKEKCAHYIGKDTIHLNRGRFIWTMIVFSIVTLGVLVLVIAQNRCAINEIVECQKEYYNKLQETIPAIELTKDSCIYVNEQFVSLVDAEMHKMNAILELHLSQQHAYFTVLSIWAGIMMIVFLVFSLYSMYKTDELHKQGKEGVQAIENKKENADIIIQSIRHNASTEIDKVKQAADDQIKNIQKASEESIAAIEKNMSEEQGKVNKRLSEMSQTYEDTYNKYTQRLNEANQASNGLMKIFMQLSKTGMASDEGGTESPEQIKM